MAKKQSFVLDTWGNAQVCILGATRILNMLSGEPISADIGTPSSTDKATKNTTPLCILHNSFVSMMCSIHSRTLLCVCPFTTASMAPNSPATDFPSLCICADGHRVRVPIRGPAGDSAGRDE